MSLTTRRPTIRFPRLHVLEADAQALLYWNGRRASNGDGVATGGAVDYAAPLAGPLAIFTADKLGALLGGALAGAALVGNGLSAASLGALQGPALIGPAFQPAGYWSWQFPFSLRNGVYLVGVVIGDAIGNLSPSAVESTFEIAAAPRAPSGLSLISYDAGGDVLSLNWIGSADLMLN